MERQPHPLADAALAAVLLLASVGYLILAQQEAVGRLQRDLLGQDGFPSILAGLGILAAGYVLVRALLRWRARTPAEREAATVGLHWEPWVLWLVSLLYVFGFRSLGFVPSTLGYAYVGFWIVGFRRPVMAAVVAASTTVVLYLVFGLFLGVDLPLFPGS